MRVRALVLVALVLTAATPTQADDVDPVAVVKTLTTDTVRVVVSIDGPDAGTVLPFCQADADADTNRTIIGTITNGCFLPFGGCEMIIVGINPNTMPPEVAAGPDWRCIEDRIEELLGQSPANRLSLPFHLQS